MICLLTVTSANLYVFMDVCTRSIIEKGLCLADVRSVLLDVLTNLLCLSPTTLHQGTTEPRFRTVMKLGPVCSGVKTTHYNSGSFTAKRFHRICDFAFEQLLYKTEVPFTIIGHTAGHIIQN